MTLLSHALIGAVAGWLAWRFLPHKLTRRKPRA